MKNTVNISITLNADLLAYIDELSLINSRSRSRMIAWIIAKEKAADEALAEEAKEYGKQGSTDI